MADSTAAKALTGLLPLALIVASTLAIPVSFLLLKLYRRSVLAGMNALAGAEPPPLAPAARRRRELPVPLQIADLGGTHLAEPPETNAEALERVVSGPWRAASVYAGAGLAYSVVMTAGSYFAEGLSGNWLQLTVLLWTYLWPGILTAILVAGYDPARRLQVLGTYFGVLALLAVWAGARNPTVGMLGVPTAWAILNGPATLLLTTFLSSRIRAVGPIVLAFLLMATIGSQAVLWVANTNQFVLRSAVSVGSQLGLGAASVVSGLILTGAVAFAAALGRPFLSTLRRSGRDVGLDRRRGVRGLQVGRAMGISPTWRLRG